MSADTYYDGDQVAIREGDMPDIKDRPCAWCQQPSVAERTVVKERKSEGEVVKPAKLAPVCQAHSDMIDRNEEIATAWRRRKLNLKNWTHPDEKKQAKARAAVLGAETTLRKYGERIDEPKSVAA
jgi:hypothetical protein